MPNSIGVSGRGEELYTREEMYGMEVNGYDYEITMLMVCHNASRAEVMSGYAEYHVYKDILRVGSWGGCLSRDDQQKELVSLIGAWTLPVETWDALVSDAVGGSPARSSVSTAGARAGSAECILAAWHGTFRELRESTQGKGREGTALTGGDRERVEGLLRGEDIEVRRAVGGLLHSWQGPLEGLIYASREAVKLGRKPTVDEGGASVKMDNLGLAPTELGTSPEKTLGPGF